LKEKCWLEDPQPPRPREPKPARAAKAMVKRQKAARRIEWEQDWAREQISRKPVARAVPPPLKAPWFEIGAEVVRQEHEHGCVVLGSESLAYTDGKVLIQFDDGFGIEQGPPGWADPAELMLRRIWHPEYGPGNFLFEQKDGELNVFFDDIDGNSIVNATDISPCVVLGKEFLANRDGKVVCHPKLGRGVIVGEENDGRPIVVFDNKHVSAHVNPAELSNSAPAVSESLAAKSVADIKAPDPAIASALGQVPRPFTPGAIAAEAAKPLETENPRLPATAGQDAEKCAERSCN
jgi:hypothetical protein